MQLHEVIWPNKYMLMLFGLWPMHPNTTLTRRLFAHLRFLVELTIVISLLVPEIMTVVIYWGDMGVLGDFGALIVSHVLLTMKMLYYMWRRRSFRSIYQHLKDFWDISDDPEERRQYEQLAKFAKLANIVCIVAGMADLLSFEFAAMIIWMKNRREINEGLHRRPFFLELDYGFDTQPTPVYEIVYVWQSLCGFCTIYGLVGFDCTMMTFILHVSGQFRLIAARFRAMGQRISDRTIVKNHHELRVEIGKLIAQHQHVMSVTKELSTLLSPIVFGQIVTSGLGICLGGYAVIEGEGSVINIAKFFVFFVSLLMQLVLWCAPAELLIQESTAIAETIYYEVPWFRLDPSLRRDLNFVMMRAQEGCHVTALYQVMSIRRITEVFNAAGSYMALLRSMKK